MRTSAFIVLALLAHSTLACGQLCATCNLNNTCRDCYKSQALNGTCVQTNNTGECLIREGREDKCIICDQPLAVNNRDGTCFRAKNPIPNCAISYGIREEVVCIACKNGTYPARDAKRCVPYNTTDLPNCLWATRRFGVTNNAECFRCKGSLSTFKGRCGAFNATGCLSIIPHYDNTRICIACNTFNGYYQRDPGALNCQKRNGTNTTAVSEFESSEGGVDSLKALLASFVDTFGNGF